MLLSGSFSKEKERQKEEIDGTCSNKRFYIYPTFLQHPTVEECCVLGLPDKDYGEAVSAIIVPEAEAKKRREEESRPAISMEELRSWAQDKLAPYKVIT